MGNGRVNVNGDGVAFAFRGSLRNGDGVEFLASQGNGAALRETGDSMRAMTARRGSSGVGFDRARCTPRRW
jgi:hypothetical protein